MIGWGDPINKAGEVFGYNNDFIALVPDPADPLRQATMWVNHETASPYFVGGYRKGGKRTREQVDRERREVGGSIIRIRRPGPDAPWQWERNHLWNRRISGETAIPIVSDRPILGQDSKASIQFYFPRKAFLVCEVVRRYQAQFTPIQACLAERCGRMASAECLFAAFYAGCRSRKSGVSLRCFRG